MLERVAIYFKDNNLKTRNGVDRLVDAFLRRGIKTCVCQKLKNQGTGSDWEVIEKSDSHSFDSETANLVLSVGGDGTFLETVLKVKDLGIPIAGVNTGRMGFLANISTEEISHSVDMLCNNEYEIVERCLLEITRPEGIFDGNSSSALNEITIQKADLSMITISVFVDDTHLNTYWADGLIVSTATG
jgi:NAD+ kinase